MSRHRRRIRSPKPGKGSVTLSSQENPSWREDLEHSNVFLALVTPEWLRSPELWEHLDYARQLGLPVRIALMPGTVLPKGLFAGVTDLEIQPCATNEDVQHYVMAVLQHGRGESSHDGQTLPRGWSLCAPYWPEGLPRLCCSLVA